MSFEKVVVRNFEELVEIESKVSVCSSRRLSQDSYTSSIERI